MNRQQLNLLRRQIRNWQPKIHLTANWEHICEEFELTDRIEGRTIRFHGKDKQWLIEQAQRSGYGNLLHDDPPDGNRIQAAEAGIINEKLAAIRPNDTYVLLTSQSGRIDCASVQGLAPGQSLRVSIHDLQLDKIDALVVVENLDCFDHWHLARLPESLQHAIAIYRGHDAQAKGVASLLNLVKPTADVVIFPDLDPAGLQIAMTTVRANLLLTCDITEELVSVGSRADYDEQFKAQSYLNNHDLAEWDIIWEELKEQRLSIKQQHMLACQVPLKIVER